MIPHSHVFFRQAEIDEPFSAEVTPVWIPLVVCTWLTEEFHFHLFKLSGTENEVTRGDLITEALADLANTKRQFLTHGSLYVSEVYEHALCCFRTQIDCVLGIFQNTLEGLEHQVELSDVGKVMRTAVRTGNVVFSDVINHVGRAHGFGINRSA